jgi:protein-disulfide isomerase
MSKQFWAVLGVIAAVFVGIIIFSGGDKSNNGSGGGQPTNHIMGSTASHVTLLEYGDYQCPACGAFFPTVQSVVDKYKDRIQFQFRNLPLTSLHPNAFAAARAAEAAGLQGKYFEMHDLLYQNQDTWAETSNPLPYFQNMAKSLSLNMDKFNKDFSSSKVNSAINADLDAFDKTGAQKATPTFFINGKQIKSTSLLDPSGQPSVSVFSKIIDQAIAAQKKT